MTEEWYLNCLGLHSGLVARKTDFFAGEQYRLTTSRHHRIHVITVTGKKGYRFLNRDLVLLLLRTT